MIIEGTLDLESTMIPHESFNITRKIVLRYGPWWHRKKKVIDTKNARWDTKYENGNLTCILSWNK
jgi:hypothetical protein